MTQPLLQISDLKIVFGVGEQAAVAVRNVSFEIAAGEMVGLVGESGCGKSLTCRAAIRLLPHNARIAAGSVMFEGRDVTRMGHRELRNLRAREVGMIFQDPFTSLNPVFRVGAQVAETLRVNLELTAAQAKRETIRLFTEAGIPDAERWFAAFPHELSGGMRQRVMIALALASKPKLLIADEPTTALDVTTQAQILKLLRRFREEHGVAVLLVSHDFGVIAETCDRVLVMYGGHVVEKADIEAVYRTPQHPYTRALLASIPQMHTTGPRRRRKSIDGRPPESGEVLPGCIFEPRCAYAREACKSVDMKLEPAASNQYTACPFVRAGGEQRLEATVEGAQ
ncbi:oligopeptide/dipeptide ABC transporter ATP-binding protein [Pararhizobium capsulatum DSM 1112]|uniref:Oligopeptide/dipeptide ABC transporter ATP-binding protein n=1 Tax=Pararhizobium capsulatum DSM 1112 TaxID=1121113 RepID=A0ABU0BYT2_9HYPH|nr:ABC transporter ATP-binding protein [Pararhizobium capsulatum]MDQ0323428.1 oligopeptide/dipeptide ABC transporter ATP-binding protein [Pararhizobium capsulatum DSM 1112]